jgi:hypothetical protein
LFVLLKFWEDGLPIQGNDDLWAGTGGVAPGYDGSGIQPQGLKISRKLMKMG